MPRAFESTLADDPGSLQSLLEASPSLLASYAENPSAESIVGELDSFRRNVAARLVQLPSGSKDRPDVKSVLGLLYKLKASGCYDTPVTAKDLALADGYAQKGWPGLLAAMFLVSAWQWPRAPRIADVARWLWPAYTGYLFSAPQGFRAVGQAQAYSAHYLRRLTELLRLAEANRGSSSVRDALNTFRIVGNCIPLYFTDESLRAHYDLRGRILTIANGIKPEPAPMALPREGRRLRVGFVSRHFGPQTESYTTLPTFEHLDPERFEVILYVFHKSGSSLEAYARSRVAEFQVLPDDVQEQIQILRDAALDVVVFGTNVTANFNEVTRAALYRIAPLQVVNNSSCTTSGLPEIDLYVSGTLTETAEAPAHFTERLGLLPGPAHAFNYEADRQELTMNWTRAALGIPEDAMVFVSAANFFKIIPEIQEAWARILAATPNSRLLLHPFNPNWSSSYPIKRFSADLDRVLRHHGVSDERLLISSLKLPSRADVRALLSVGDVYLDTYPFAGVNSLVDPLEAGMPVVAWDGQTFRSRMGGSLLRALGLEALIAHDAESYHSLCLRLANDAPWRADVKAKIAHEMAKRPIFLDSLAHSDAFGGILETAYDELSAVGPEAFRSERKPILAESEFDEQGLMATANVKLNMNALDEAGKATQRCLSGNPTSTTARHMMGLILLRNSFVGRAVTYLTAAANSGSATSRIWRDLAVAQKQAGNRKAFIDALETSLRVDGTDLESWFMLADTAIACGHTEIQQMTYRLLAKLAPDDPRTSELRSRLEYLQIAV